MTDFTKRYFKSALTPKGIKEQNWALKFLYVFLTLITASKSVSLFEQSVFAGIFFVFSSASLFLLIGFLFYIFIDGPEEFFYKETTELVNHVSRFFTKDFYDFKSYIYEDKIYELKRKIKVNELPSLEMLTLWRYRLSERQMTYQISLPVVAIMIINALTFMMSDPIIVSLQNSINDSFGQSDGKSILDSLSEVVTIMKYPYLIYVYFSKLDDVGKSVHKVDLLIAIKSSSNVC